MSPVGIRQKNGCIELEGENRVGLVQGRDLFLSIRIWAIFLKLAQREISYNEDRKPTSCAGWDTDRATLGLLNLEKAATGGRLIWVCRTSLRLLDRPYYIECAYTLYTASCVLGNRSESFAQTQQTQGSSNWVSGSSDS